MDTQPPTPIPAPTPNPASQPTPVQSPTSPVASPSPTPAPSLEPVDQLAAWPGAFGAYKFSAAAVKLNVGTLVLIYLVSFVLSVIFGLFHNPVLSILGSIVVSSITSAAYIFVQLAGVRGQRVDINQALKAALPLAIRAFLLTLLMEITLLVSALLLIIPALIILPRLALSYFFLVDQHLGPVEAMKASWHATKGHAGKVWGIIGVSILMVLPVITIIGIIATVYLFVMYSAVLACLYVFLMKAQPAATTPAS